MKKYVDCSKIKGVVFMPSYARNDIETWRDYDAETVERELGYAARYGFNSVRIFLHYIVYADNREKFLNNLLHTVRTAEALGLSVMPVVWDSCFSEKEPFIGFDNNEWMPNPGVMNLGEQFWAKGEEYCLDLINLLKDEKGLLMWDLMNEPLCTSYVSSYSPEVNEEHKQEIYRFLKHFCEFFDEHDGVNPTNIGHVYRWNNNDTADWTDILAFHDYSATESNIEKSFEEAVELGKKFGKQMFCSEMSCAGRANPYDLTVAIANKYNVGYYMWELMIGRCYWGDRHGLVYPDGTIRDTSVFAAVNGFFRRRENRRALNTNIEGNASWAIKRIEDYISSENKSVEEGIETLSHAANLLEANLLVPECDLPTADYYAIKNSANPTTEEITAKLTEWLPVLKKTVGK